MLSFFNRGKIKITLLCSFIFFIPYTYAQNETKNDLKKITEDIKKDINIINSTISNIKKSLEERTEEIKSFKESITKIENNLKSISENIKVFEEKTNEIMRKVNEYERKIEDSRRQAQVNLMAIRIIGIVSLLSIFISIIALLRAEKKKRSRTLRF